MKKQELDFEKLQGLIPTIIQDNETNEILMLGFMNQEAFDKTKQSGFVHFWSRSRKKIWKKGDESGNTLEVKELFLDCDNDSLLIKATLHGKNCCHTGERSCFHKKYEI